MKYQYCGYQTALEIDGWCIFIYTVDIDLSRYVKTMKWLLNVWIRLRSLKKIQVSVYKHSKRTSSATTCFMCNSSPNSTLRSSWCCAPTDFISESSFSSLTIMWYLSVASSLAIPVVYSKQSDKLDLFAQLGVQFLICSTSISNFDGSISIPFVLCSLKSNGRLKRVFFKLVLPARSWPTSTMRPR